MVFRSSEQLNYEYHKLSEPDAVRLIQLHPSPYLESPLQCELLSTTLTRCYNNLIDKYTALSYVWGDPQLSSKITVDGRTMLITASLASALRHLRDSTRKRIIWADAICINQRDTLERNQQVSQMNSVYFLAHHTIIYLGDSTPATDQILNDLRSRSLILATQRFSKPSAVRDELDKEMERAALESIFSRPWFKRVWVLQELVLSLDPWLQCGTSLARWHDFREYISSTGLAQGMEGARVASEMANLHLEYSKMRHETVHGYMREINPKDIAKQLLEILISRRAFGVQDPRDMIFAHLGLIDKRDPRSVLTVDYVKSKRTIYTQVANYLLDNLYNYSILSLAEGSGERDKDLPSWTPDW
ncbi:heterokaryon incompatibility protein-domain-containing protein, partial [Bisporella sp. PMI_857]